jgi:geranylgeranyl pyrophosphate synthase
MRRGAPCTFLKYGVDIALNTGNFMYFIPMLLTQRFFKDDKETLLKLLEIYHEEMVIIHLGQNWDINWHNNDYIPTEEQYLQMVAFKTGVLPRMALRMCTHILGLNESLQEAFFNFAQNIGIAFQIQDDIINLESEEFAKGKEILGEDIYEVIIFRII